MAGFPNARFLTSANQPGQFVPDAGAEVAFAGRSNAGKSSAINAITHQRQLARTSASPGRTQLVNFFALAEGLRLVDLPGYGYARVPEKVQAHWRGLLEHYFASRGSLRGLFLVVDSRRGLLPLDRQMLEWTGSLGRPAHVLLTKSDKLSRSEGAAALRAAAASCGQRCTVQLFSAQSGAGLDEARQRLAAMLQG
jgi:GTP-binding protein